MLGILVEAILWEGKQLVPVGEVEEDSPVVKELVVDSVVETILIVLVSVELSTLDIEAELAASVVEVGPSALVVGAVKPDWERAQINTLLADRVNDSGTHRGRPRKRDEDW